MTAPSAMATYGDLSEVDPDSCRLLAIDPGYEHLGYSWWIDGAQEESGSFRDHWYEPSIMLEQFKGFADVLIVEQMVSYPRSNVDPNDLIKCTRTVGHAMGIVQAPIVIYPKPSQWKGRIAKEVHHRRAIRSEPCLIDLDRDALDAYLIAQWALHFLRRFRDRS